METKSAPSLKQRYEDVLKKIAEAAVRSGRKPGSIVVVAITKHASIDQIRGLMELGHVDFGENRVQILLQRAAQIDEFLQRHRELNRGKPSKLPEHIRWHMVGHLQRNKVRKVLPVVRLVHSVDSLRLAEEVQIAAGRFEEPVEVLVQVNTSGEKKKFGVAPAAARHLVEQIDTMMSLRPRGLMCIAPFADDPAVVRPVFERAQELLEDIRSARVGGERFDILSMGMSNDFEVAVECGANVLRIGSAIFGPGEEEPEEE